jgi:hypothetical protein
MMVRTDIARIGRPADSLSAVPVLRRAGALTLLLCAAAVEQKQSYVFDHDAATVAAKVAALPAVLEGAAPLFARYVVAHTADGVDVRWEGFAPHALVMPVVRVLPHDGVAAVPPLTLAPVQADADGCAQTLIVLPQELAAATMVIAAIAVAPQGSNGSGATGWGILSDRVTIGGHTLGNYGDSSYYNLDDGDYECNVSRFASGQGPLAQTLWYALLDEGGESPEPVVSATSFAPGQLPLNQLGILLEGNWSLPAGHVLRLRVYEQDPTGNYLSGPVLWEDS